MARDAENREAERLSAYRNIFSGAEGQVILNDLIVHIESSIEDPAQFAGASRVLFYIIRETRRAREGGGT